MHEECLEPFLNTGIFVQVLTIVTRKYSTYTLLRLMWDNIVKAKVFSRKWIPENTGQLGSYKQIICNGNWFS